LADGPVDAIAGTITINGTSLRTSSAQNVAILIGAATNDVQGSNGVIHVIGSVLLP